MPATVAATDHRIGFRDLASEIEAEELEVSGSLPDWLAGSLIRMGPAKFEVGGRAYRHWFDGLAMMHRFAFEGGRVSYTNRFLESRVFLAARDEGRIAYSEFATDPCRTLFKRAASVFSGPSFGDNANVNVMRQGDDFVAMTETPLPVRFDPATLRTLGVGEPAPGQLTVAHPHSAPVTGELVSYAAHLGPRSSYRLYARAPGGPMRIISELPVSRPSYMHSFAITERYAVLVEFPLVAVPASIPLSGRPFIENYRWRPERGTRFQVIDLETGKLRGTYEGEPFFAFHHINAFERDGELLIDLCSYEDDEIIRGLYMDRLRSERPRLPLSEIRRCRLPLDGSAVEYEPLAEGAMELPRIDYARCNGREYRQAYGCGQSEGSEFLDQIIRIDTHDHTRNGWQEPGCFPGEPVFVRDPAGEGEDGAVLLSVTLDAARERSFLLVLDAASLQELARAEVPHAIPFGFHGQFDRGQSV